VRLNVERFGEALAHANLAGLAMPRRASPATPSTRRMPG
jgi:hypothetical protein